MADSIIYREEADSVTAWRWVRRIGLGIVIVVTSAMAGCPVYNVWQQGMAGEGELRRAQQNRQIEIARAEATREASKSLAMAEIERSKGVAEANKIIGDSLKNNESYLRYLWVHSLEKSQATVIYIPTEANLPLLEAQRLDKLQGKK